MTRGPKRRRLGVLALSVLVAGCGSTVPLGAQSTTGNSNGSPLLNAAPGVSAAPGSDSGGASATDSPSSAGAGGADAGQLGSGSTPGSLGASGGPIGSSSVNSPLKVGITYVDNSGSSAALGGPSTAYSFKTATEALIKGINASGGLAGRRIVPVTYVFNAQSSDYSVAANAACAKFTQDDRVSVVLDSSFGYTAGFGECLQKAKILHITSTSEPDRASSQKDSLHFNTGMTTPERSYSAAVTDLFATGYLSKASKLGVIIEECPSTRTAYDKTIAPLITHLGMKAPLTRTFSCTTGFSSAGSAASAIASEELAFRSAGVDRVMFVSDYEYVAWLFFQNQAAQQTYRPGYVLTSNAQAEALRTSVNEKQRPQIHGVGWVPMSDAAIPAQPVPAVEQRCIRYAQVGGAAPASQDDRLFVHLQCAEFLLLEAALKRTGGVSTATALADAIRGLGTSFVAPGLVAGRTRYSATRHDGPDAMRVFGYVVACSCVRYTGPVLNAPA